MIINNFLLFLKLIHSAIFNFDIKDIKRGNWERQIARDGKLNIYFKNNFNLLVMNVTQLNFLTDKMCIYDTLLKLIIREVCCL